MSPILFALAVIAAVSTAQPLRSEMAADEIYPGYLHETPYDENKQLRNLDSIEMEGSYKQLKKELGRWSWRSGGTLDTIGGGHLIRNLDEGSDSLDEYGRNLTPEESKYWLSIAREHARNPYTDSVHNIERTLDTIGGNHLIRENDQNNVLLRSLDTIGGSHLLRENSLDAIGGGHLIRGLENQRSLDTIGGSHLLRETENERSLDTIGGSHLIRGMEGQRSLDTIGGSHLLRGMNNQRSLDTIGGSHLLRGTERDGSLDTIGGGHLIRGAENERSLDTIGGSHLIRGNDNREIDGVSRSLDKIGGSHLLRSSNE